MARADRLEILTVIEGQIEGIYGELHTQTKRIAELQAQVDDLREKLRRSERI
jgi:hypothetical protein